MMDILPSTIITVYSLNFGIIVEVIIFSILLGARVGLLQKEKKKHQENLLTEFDKNDQLQKKLIRELQAKKELQNKVNRELEDRVKARTEMLEEANQKILMFAKEMDKLNSELDKYNYSLKKEFKEERLSRIFHLEITFEEFLQIYPDDDSCLIEIQRLKWPDNFVCRKCGHDKSTNARIWYRKKCTKCDYIESLTAHTLFHHLKFPLNKAFYLSYIEFGKLEYSDEQLSEIIELRKATISVFRKKVKNRVKEKKYQKITNWKEIIID
jgi:membrane-associated HD superfamily phosphohydrolase